MLICTIPILIVIFFAFVGVVTNKPRAPGLALKLSVRYLLVTTPTGAPDTWPIGFIVGEEKAPAAMSGMCHAYH